MERETEVAAILRAAFPEIESNDPVSYFSRNGDVFSALSYAWLFWPKILEVHGAVFMALDGYDKDEIVHRLSTPIVDPHRSPPLSSAQVVDSYNTFEVAQLFRRWREPREHFVAANDQLANILVETWRSRLIDVFPGREFLAETLWPEEAEELTIRVRQLSPNLDSPQGWDSAGRYIRDGSTGLGG